MKLGRIEKVELRDVWKTEDKHFTSWLAQSENLELLGEKIGIELELESPEKGVGPYRADILCKDTTDDSWVVIENQIEKTDHKHLGQLMTYAAGLGAKTIVWIAAKICDEHRAAVDWLNSVTSDNVRCFALEVQLWRIEGSPAAPRFEIICQPNEWSRTVQQMAQVVSLEGTNRSEQLRIKYWTDFRNYIQDNGRQLRPQKPGINHWYSFGVGSSKAHTNALLISRDKKIGVELTITSDDAKTIFNELLLQKEQVEAIIGTQLDWREMPENKVSRIQLYKESDPSNTDNWHSQFEWLAQNLELFDKAFRPFFHARKSISD